MSITEPQVELSNSAIQNLKRPSRQLMSYYGLLSLLLGPFFFIPLTVLAIRYTTLSYSFDDEGVSMSWGRLFRREVHLAYHQIQDIHLVSNLIERWLGLARIQVQTASGSAGAEMTIEGIEAHAALRNYLYDRMRGARAETTPQQLSPEITTATSSVGSTDLPTNDELTSTLREVAAELRSLRQALESQKSGQRNA